MILPKPRLMLITDRHQARTGVDEAVEGALAGGCRWISIRDRDMSSRERRTMARRLVKKAERYGAVATLHGDVAGAEAARAHGVHVGQGTSPAAVREMMGGDAFVGASVHSWDEAEYAQGHGADYLTVSPIFETESKPGYGPALGLEILEAFCDAATVPVVALGGITPDNARDCLDAGAEAVAVMGEVMRARDPRTVTEGYIESLKVA